MKIHIVARDSGSDQILARLAKLLADAPGFTVSNAPDPAASINVFFPYLEWDLYKDFHATPTAAWFSHRDDQRREKVSMWQQAAQAVDLRLTSAQIYEAELSAYGPTAVVTPPLDREKFVPGALHDHEIPVVGTSGFVYPGGRKGEELIARLATERPDMHIIASGEGWPVPTQHYAWDKMQKFYHRLDVYLCTSSIEGIGYGPLEALACGVPVVVPAGVGVFDELPKFAGIHRYEAGNYSSMVQALDDALARVKVKAVDQRALREATWPFTAEAWINDHLRAFEQYLHGVPDSPPVVTHDPADWRAHAGVYYVAYGDPARQCAERAIASFKAFMPGIAVALVSDRPLNAGEDVFIQHEDEDIGARSTKTRIYDLAPQAWELVLYLDADTEVVADISFLFETLVDGWEAFYCINPAQYVLSREMSRPDNQDECRETFKLMGSDEMLQLNGGVFGFRRCDRTAAFFRAWHDEWARYGKRDQAALDRVLYTQPLRLYVLGNEFNTITRYLPPERTAGILHYPMQARRWRGVINGRLDGSEAWAAVHPSNKTETKQ